MDFAALRACLASGFRFLDRFDALVPVVLALGLYATGELLAYNAPAPATSGLQLLVWGFAISTVVLYHATFTVNSLAHTLGRRRYATRDQSRNLEDATAKLRALLARSLVAPRPRRATRPSRASKERRLEAKRRSARRKRDRGRPSED